MFRFTIRELVLLTLVVAMGVGWWIDRRQLAVPAADYRRLKADELQRVARSAEFFKELRASFKAQPVTQLQRASPLP